MSDDGKTGQPSEIEAIQPPSSMIQPIESQPSESKPLDTGYSAPPSYSSNREWEEDRRSLSKAQHDALNGFLQSSVIQRADLLRDTLAVSVTILFGALTIYFTSAPDHTIIKTPLLFFFALVSLTIGIIVNLLARTEIISHLQEVSYQIEKNYLNLFVASRNLMKNPSQMNIDTAYRIESELIDFPKLKWRGQYGHVVAIWTIIMCIAALSLSFVLTIRL